MSKHLAPDFENAPYWWDAAAPVAIPSRALLPSYDVVIVGSGYTGLRAALTLSRAGRGVAVFDEELPGFGASRRNAGFLGRTLKKPYRDLKRSKGAAFAAAAYRELDAAYQTTLDFVEKEKIDCHLERCGRLIGATSAAHYAQMELELASMNADLGLPYTMLPRNRMHREMATRIYHGGAVIPDLGAMHPGLYHRGLMTLALESGSAIFGNTEVFEIARGPGSNSYQVSTAAGATTARDVVIATNGYTPRNFTWHSRRVIPFTGYMAATELLPSALIEKLLPHRRTVIDSNLDIDFFRPAPDSPRILFGGATANGLENPDDIAALLHRRLARALPDLSDIRFSRVWTGKCAGTFDMMPHLGCHDGVWYGMGYNFAGIPMGTYFGMKIATGILGLPGAASIFAQSSFPTMPLYSGNPWFLPIAMRYFDWQDRRLAARRGTA